MFFYDLTGKNKKPFVSSFHYEKRANRLTIFEIKCNASNNCVDIFTTPVSDKTKREMFVDN